MPYPLAACRSHVCLPSSVIPWYALGSNCIAAYLAKGAVNLAASKVNLANPGTYNLTGTSDPTFATATGWTFDGVSNFLNTGIGMSTDKSILVRIANAAETTGTPFGVTEYLVYTLWLVPQSTGVFQYNQGDANISVAPAATSGVFGIAGYTAYRNGSNDGVIAGTPSLSTTLALALGASNADGVIANFYTGDILALAIYDKVLSASEVTVISAAMAAL